MLVQIVLFDGFDLLDAIAPYEVFVAAGQAAGGRVDVELVSVAGARPVPSGSGGLPISASGRPDLERASILLVPGAAGRVSGEGPDTVPAMLAREAAGELPDIVRLAFGRPNLTVATVCGGSLILSMAGLIQGRPAVTHHLGMDALQATGAVPVRARVVDDGNLVSGGGVTSGLDVALYLVERELGPRIARAVEMLFEYERRGTVWRKTGLEPVGFASPTHVEPVAAAPAVPSEPASAGFAGRWDVAIATPLGNQAVVYAFSVLDGTVEGTATQAGETAPLQNLTAAGNRLTWSQHVTKPLKLHLRFDVLVDGDVMTGTAKAGVLPASKLTGRRLSRDGARG